MLTTRRRRTLKKLRGVWEMQKDYDITYPCNERLDELFNDTKWFKSRFKSMLYKTEMWMNFLKT